MSFHRIFRAFLSGLMVVIAGGIVQAKAAPSSNCDGVQGKAEQFICEDDMLNALDRKIDEVYERARQVSSPEDGELIQSQRQWIEDRNSCINSPKTQECMKREYALRISYLEVKYGLQPVANMSRYECRGADTGKPLRFKAMTYNTIVPSLALWSEDKKEQYLTFLGRLEGRKLYTGNNAKLYRENGQSIIEIDGTAHKCEAF